MINDHRSINFTAPPDYTEQLQDKLETSFVVDSEWEDEDNSRTELDSK